MSSNRDDVSLDNIRLLIGECCTHWASIDFAVGVIIQFLAIQHHRAYDDENSALPFDILLRNMDLREKIQSAKAIAFLVCGNNSFYHELSSNLDYIANDLRNERNRLIHDDWVPTESGISQIQYHAKVVKTGARLKELQFRKQKEHQDLHELRSFADTLSDLYDQLTFYLDQIRDHPEHVVKSP